MAYTYKYKETEEQRRARMTAFLERRGKTMESKSTQDQTCTGLDMAPGLEADVNYKQKFVYSRISSNHVGKTNTAAERVPLSEIMEQVNK